MTLRFIPDFPSMDSLFPRWCLWAVSSYLLKTHLKSEIKNMCEKRRLFLLTEYLTFPAIVEHSATILETHESPICPSPSLLGNCSQNKCVSLHFIVTWLSFQLANVVGHIFKFLFAIFRNHSLANSILNSLRSCLCINCWIWRIVLKAVGWIYNGEHF